MQRFARLYRFTAVVLFVAAASGLSIRAEDKLESKVESRLRPIIEAIADGRAGNADVTAQLKVAAGRSLAAAPGETLALDLDVHNINPQVLKAIEASGAQVTHSAPQWNAVSVNATPEVIASLVEMDSVKHIKLARKPLLRKSGIADNQADISLKADQVRNTFGLTGAGQKVGVVSDSCRDTSIGPGSTSGAAPNITLSGLAPQLSGDMPSTIQITTSAIGGGTDEGSGMMELIHDIAPNAALGFAPAGGSQTQYATNLGNLVTSIGCTVTVDDVFFLDEPFFQDGPIAQRITTNAGLGVPHFSAAGNDADHGILMTYKSLGTIVDETSPAKAGTPLSTSNFHDWGIGGGTPAFLPLTVTGGGGFSVVMQWNEPYSRFSLGTGSHRDYDLYVASAQTLAAVQAPLASSKDSQGTAATPTGDPYEEIDYTNNTGSTQTVYLVVNHFRGSQTLGTVLRLVFYNASGVTFPSLVSAMTAGGHSASAEGINVGAIFYGDIDSNGQFNPDFSAINAESFTCKGGIGAAGVPIYFNTSGTLLAGAPVLRDVPDIASPDGSNTTFFGSPDINVTVGGKNYDPDSFPNFFGTSAAAPNAAAVAALIKERTSTMTPAQLKSLLKSTARDIVASDPPSAAGPDDRTGAGLVDALAAINAAPGVLTHPANQSIIAGQNTSFTITAAGSPTLSFQWEEAPVSGTPSNIVGATSATLNLTAVPSNKNGFRYRCKVTNAFGTATSRDAILRVSAGTKTWVGLALDNNWNTASNWNPSGVPTIADDVVFPNTLVTTTITLGANQFAFSLTLNGAVANSITINGTGGFSLTIGGTSIQSLGPTATISSGVVLLSSSEVTIDTTGNLTLSGVVTGPPPIKKLGAGTLTLSGANTNFGSPLSVNAGSLNIASNPNLGLSANTISLGAGTLLVTANFSLNRAIAMTGAGTISVSSGITLNATDPIIGTTGFTKAGTGTLVLKGASTNTGTTTVSQGTMLVSGSLASASTVAVSSGATLGGNGTVGIVNVSGTLAPGEPGTASGVGKLTAAGNVSFGATSTLAIQIPSVAANAFDVFNHPAGNLAITSGAVLQLNLSGLAAGTAAEIAVENYLNGSGAPFILSVTNNTNNISPVKASYKNVAPKQVLAALGTVAVTPVRIADFTARPQGAAIVVEWTAVSELKNAGFNIWRRQAGEEWKQANPNLIAGRLTANDAKEYAFTDWAEPGEYEYALETIDLAGAREFYEAAEAVVFDAAHFNELKLAAVNDAELSIAAAHSRDRAQELITKVSVAKAKVFAPIPSVLVRAPLEGSFASTTVGAREVARQSIPTQIAAPRWFAASTPTRTTRSKAVKAAYRGSGVLWIPRENLPRGYDVEHLTIQREGRAVTALSASDEGIAFFAPGYSDEYTDQDAFFLRRSNVRTPAGIPIAAGGLFNSTVAAETTVTATAHLDFHDVYFDFSNRPFNFPPWFSDQYLTQGTTQTFAINLPDAASAPGKIVLNAWSVPRPGSGPHAVQAFVNGAFVGEKTWMTTAALIQFSFDVSSNIFTSGKNTVDFVTPDLDGAPQLSFVNGISAEYERTLRAAEPLDFALQSQASQIVEVSALASPEAWVVDARYPDRAALVAYESQPRGDGTFVLRFMARGGGTGRYLVTPRGRELSPTLFEERTIQSLRSGTKWLAVGPKQFDAPLEPLVRMHSKEGLKAAFVDQEQIFDCYGYGRYGPQAIQNAVRAARPAYLLLAGRTTYDYRNYSGANVDPLCPSFLIATTYWSQTTGDALFGDLGRGYSEVSVGRLPANTPDEMAVAVAHTLANTPPSHSGLRVLASADAYDPDTADFAGLADLMSGTLPEIAWSKSYKGVNTPDSPGVTDAMKSAANGNADAIVYFGHGNSARLGATVPRILDADRIQAWTGNVVFLQGTCTANWVAKDENGFRSIAIQGLVQPQGGLSASIGTSTYLHAESGAEFITRVLAEAQFSGVRWGDAVRNAQQWSWMRAAQDAASAQIYLDMSRTQGILGDPALRIYGITSPAASRRTAADKF